MICQNNVKLEENLNISLELKKITFKVITKILFGRDINKIDKWEYTSPKDGSVKMLNFEDAYFQFWRDVFEAQLSAFGRLLLFLIKLKISEPFKSNNRNQQIIFSALRKFLEISEDNRSVYRQLIDSKMLPKEEIFYDTLFILFAGFSTTYHNLSSTLYYLYKYPQKLNILKESLCKSNISNINVNDEESLKDLYENCNYLNYVVKEGLRIDPPVFASIFYQPKQNIEIWGLEIDKNTILAVNWALPHYNTKEWHNPTEFIPERFDPESDFFLQTKLW